jgi:hypothetical protein
MFFINSLDTRPGEAELLAVFAAYAADRLLPKHLRRRLSVTINTTAQPVRVPISRDHMIPQRGFLRQSPPTDFAFTTSVSVGMRDAMEIIAHEMIHISQICHGRTRVQKRRVGAGMSARQIHIVSWCRAKPTPIDQIEWHKRPWEIEACDWQAILVDEFLVRSSGTVPTVTLQKRQPDKLALYRLPKNPTPAARVTPVSTVPCLSYTPEPQKNPSHVAITPVTTAAELQPISAADREVEVAGLPSRRRLRQEVIEEKRHELLLRGLISQ